MPSIVTFERVDLPPVARYLPSRMIRSSDRGRWTALASARERPLGSRRDRTVHTRDQKSATGLCPPLYPIELSALRLRGLEPQPADPRSNRRLRTGYACTTVTAVAGPGKRVCLNVWPRGPVPEAMLAAAAQVGPVTEPIQARGPTASNTKITCTVMVAADRLPQDQHRLRRGHRLGPPPTHLLTIKNMGCLPRAARATWLPG